MRYPFLRFPYSRLNPPHWYLTSTKMFLFQFTHFNFFQHKLWDSLNSRDRVQLDRVYRCNQRYLANFFTFIRSFFLKTAWRFNYLLQYNFAFVSEFKETPEEIRKMARKHTLKCINPCLRTTFFPSCIFLRLRPTDTVSDLFIMMSCMLKIFI